MEHASPVIPVSPVRVMLVDDSAVVRHLISQALSSDAKIAVVATAANGSTAIPLAAQCKPDIIILDIEMPEMDGITALPKLLAATANTRIIMASTLTRRNANISLQALELGACDYVAKPSSLNGGYELNEFYRQLREKICALGIRSSTQSMRQKAVYATPRRQVKAIAIAASTGGPQALRTLLEALKGQFLDIPVFITQHMPPVFTALLAEHLSKAADRPCHECKDSQRAQPGHIYLAPGDFHMLAVNHDGTVILRLDQHPPENFCRPSADPMFRSLSAVYGESLLVLVLTGMGSDGLYGAQTAATAGSMVIAQDEATSVVWGMPRAVTEAGICQAVLPLADIAPYMIRTASYAS